MNTSSSTSTTASPGPGEKALFLVESPFQLLCAYEIIARYQLDYVLALRMSGSGRNDEQLTRTAKILGVKYVEIVARVGRLGQDMLRAWPRILPLLTRRYEHLFLGSYYSGFIRILRRGVRSERTWILDDGLASLRAQAEMMQSGRTSDLATCLELQELPGQTILHHRLESVIALNSVEYTDHAFFIGQPYVELGMMTKKAYEEIVGFSRKECKARLTYIPHRAESTQRIDELQQNFDLHIHYPPTCIELDLVQQGKVPKQVFNVMSTAAFTIARMFPETTVTIFPAPLSGVSPALVDTVEYARSIHNMKINTTVAAAHA